MQLPAQLSFLTNDAASHFGIVLGHNSTAATQMQYNLFIVALPVCERNFPRLANNRISLLLLLPLLLLYYHYDATNTNTKI